MGSPSRPKRVRLIAGLISADERYFCLCRKALTWRFGALDFESPALDFTWTAYYNEELGGNLKRKFFSFERLVSLEGIARIKLATNALERRLAHSGRRSINIDPGYVDLSKLVLLTTKDHAHRLYLSNGIYAEVTLYYRNNTFNAWDWTYPDYRTREYMDIFNGIRARYKQEMSENRP